MRLDRMQRHALTDEVDAVVVGTGAGGAPLLARLARAGLRVVALEAGDNHDPEHYPADEVAAAPIYWLDERLSAGMPEAFGANNSGRGVGGSMLHWGAFAPRPDPRDLRLRSTTGAGEDWPLPPEALAPYYQELEHLLGVSGPSPYPWDSSRTYPAPPVALNAPALAMRAGCDALGLRSAPGPVAVATRPWTAPDAPDRPACINCGHCHQGCRTGAKATMDWTFLPQAAAWGAEIRPGCMAVDIERNDTGRVTGVVYREAGQMRRQRCAALFLCAGAVETPRLLLHTGIGNGSGQVGRNYMAHLATQVWGTFETEMRGNKGYPSSLITEDMVRPKGAGFAGGYLLQSLGVLPVTLAMQVTRGRGWWGRRLMDYLARYNHLAGIGMNGDCLPNDDNYLALSDEVDGSGMRKPLIHFSYGPNESAMDAHATQAMRRIWEAAGATDIWTCPRSAHTIGTCRMGVDASRSVVDPACRSHEVPNLFVCDNSVFPSAMAANPALTIMALSLRTADLFLSGA